MTKRKIVLDADVIINFSRASILSRLTDIMQSYDFIVLDKVYNEIHYTTYDEGSAEYHPCRIIEHIEKHTVQML